MILKTKKGAICGGYTSKNWTDEGCKISDPTAFVFNMERKFVQSGGDYSIYVRPNGFEFGCNVLQVSGERLNEDYRGCCDVGKVNGYDIEGDQQGKSPLTGEKEIFTCEELEVYKVISYD